jgi:uncharacterized protein
VPTIRLFDSAQLDLALGRANVVHAALLTGRESDTVLVRCAALTRFWAEESNDTGQHGRAEGRHGQIL